MEYDNKFIMINSIVLAPVIIISTMLHHLFPQVLQVPNVRGPYTYEPFWIDLILIDAFVSFLAILIIYHGYKTHGKYRITCFLYGSIVFSGLEECFWILGGRFKIIPFQTYFFTRGGLWFFEIPFATCLAWFVIAWSCVYIAEIIFPNRNYVFHALIAGILAVSLDLFMDPVMVNLGSISRYPDSKGSWVWLMEPNVTFSIFSIPFYNFLGWFFVIFLFAIIYYFVLNEKKIKNRGKNKSAIIFFGYIPIFLFICFFLIFLVYLIISPFFVGVDLIPIGSI